jgi:putative sterol carrier protein
MAERATPPPDIAPGEFFTRWIPDSVAADPTRRERLGGTDATLEFELVGDGGGCFTLEIEGGSVRGREGASPRADLHLRLDVETWRALNSGDLSAPEAFLRRRVHLRGNLALAIKLHLIIG